MLYANNLLLEILKHDKIRGTICIRNPHSKIWGDSSLCPLPVISAHVCGELYSGERGDLLKTKALRAAMLVAITGCRA